MTLCRLISTLCFLPGLVALGQSPHLLEKSGNALPEAPLAHSAADAGAGQGDPVPLTLAQAIAMAERNSPRVQEAAALNRRAVAAKQIAHAYSNPNVEVYQGEQYARPIATPGVPGLLQHYAGYQPIEIPSERRARQRAAEAGIQSSQFGQQAVSLSVVGDTKRAFYNALRRREEIDHARENQQLVEDLRRRVEVSVNVGEEGRLELTRAEAELGRARFAVTSAQLEHANAIALLRVTIAGRGRANLDTQGLFERTPGAAAH